MGFRWEQCSDSAAGEPATTLRVWWRVVLLEAVLQGGVVFVRQLLAVHLDVRRTWHVWIKWSNETQTPYRCHGRGEGDSLLEMDTIGWLILVAIVLVIAVVAFVVIRRRRRGGGVIATKDKG